MHATHGEIDLKRLGGLWRKLPVTTITFVLGGLALAGVPLAAGFFSKDQILASAYEAGRTGLWITALITSGFTALYATRATVLAFFGRSRYEGDAHESPLLMTVPMSLLAAGAVFGGLLGLSATSGRIPTFLAPVFGEAEHAAEAGLSEAALIGIAVAVAAAGILIGWLVYGSGLIDWAALRVRLGLVQRTLARGWFIDDLYGSVLVMPGKAVSAFAAYVFDQRVIDGAVNGLGNAIGRLASVGRRVQSGIVRRYALAFLLGVVGLLVVAVGRSS
jgi:NADH-quinone oxidoreductase subunit L